MVLKINFDASFIPETHVSGISVVIKTSKEKIILKSSKKIICKNNCEAELRALNKAIGYINNKQSKGLLPKKCTVLIYGDNQGTIEISKRMRRMKGIEKGLMLGFLKELQIIRRNNEVIFTWILRNKNTEAHSIAKAVLNK